MIGDIVLLGVVFFIGYSLGYEDLQLNGQPRPKDSLDKMIAAAEAKREAYLASKAQELNTTPEEGITDCEES